MRTALLLAALLLTSADGYYSVTVTRLGQDVYQDENTGIKIQTDGCPEYCIRDYKAVLKFDQHDTAGNRLLFGSGAECRVKTIFR